MQAVSAGEEMPIPSSSVAAAATAAGSSTARNALRQAKRALRREMALRLNSLDTPSIASQSSQITSHVLQHRLYQKAEKISIYVSMDKGEVDTEELCRQTLSSGKRLYVPRFAVAAASALGGEGVAATEAAVATTSTAKFSTDMRMLRIYDWKDFEAMVMNKWGIREPEDELDTRRREDALEESTGGDGLDLILAPGVAFDTNGGRLGHGKGYYDRYIERCDTFAEKRNRAGPSVVGLALQEQILASGQEVPADEQDRVLDEIVTVSGPLLVKSASPT